MKFIFLSLLWLSLLGFGFGFDLSTYGQGSPDSESLRQTSSELFRQIWSPYCKGVSLLECPSGPAQDLRDQLRNRLIQGESSDSLLKEMYQRFGEEKLVMEPKISGRGSLAYVLPWIFILIAGMSVALFWMRKKSWKALGPLKSRSGSLSEESSNQILKDLNERR